MFSGSLDTHMYSLSLSLVLSLFFKNIGVLNDGSDMLNRDFRNIWGRLVPARTLFPVFEKNTIRPVGARPIPETFKK